MVIDKTRRPATRLVDDRLVSGRQTLLRPSPVWEETTRRTGGDDAADRGRRTAPNREQRQWTVCIKIIYIYYLQYNMIIIINRYFAAEPVSHTEWWRGTGHRGNKIYIPTYRRTYNGGGCQLNTHKMDGFMRRGVSQFQEAQK